jgi:hypothetical protein
MGLLENVTDVGISHLIMDHNPAVPGLITNKAEVYTHDMLSDALRYSFLLDTELDFQNY